MNPPLCHGPFRPALEVRNSSVMRYPYSAASSSSTSSTSSETSADPSSPIRAVSPFDSHDPLRLSPISPIKPQLHSSRSPAPFHDTGSSRLKRRASQGSILTKPSPVSRFLSRSNASLHLPSFEELGLSSKFSRSDSQSSPSQSRLRLSTGPTASSSSLATRAAQSSSTGWDSSAKSDYLSALPPTPPDDNDHIAWNPTSDMLLFESHVTRDHGPTMVMDEGPNIGNSPARTDGLSSPSDQLSNVSPSSSGGSPGSSGEMDCDHSSWLENSIEATVSSLSLANSRGEAVKIVSHMLPYPRPGDKAATISPNDSVYCSLVQAVQNRLRHGQSPYINVTHAVPEQFSLSNLPSSPSHSPRSLFSNDDYFNSTVFSSAAVVSAYHDFRGPIQSRSSSHSPMPVVPPMTVHLSILERYLPPSSAQEYKDLFSPYRPSFLVDRLFELSPDGGSLLFVYPTRRGGSTFKSQYLGPILDPLLRQLVVVNELSTDIGRYLGKLSSVSHLDDFDTMREHLAQLCGSLSSSSSQFSVVDARKGSAHLDRELWTEWFIHQEKARMKEVLSVYWQNGRRLPATKAVSNVSSTNYILEDKEVTSAMLLGEILDGIRRRPYGEDSEPHDGVELGVFVIRRSHS
ncbi:uncharacterized protein BP01DRAFT_359442 [Aspergillus saccharolyticus JOP 1030-1]|uniref:Uncharacterized protein n=1 Tax=Aspergillus saccharolyticus JOP 1030-1 TaxID=1450539 RepID=A0A318Z9B8_9EURO|nr:hypothetical protein BP01DRAFT_361515 [Aspergillus saccharolyticus JOP 1030-1]XP_025428330.1 hypothetical protein BP01DRAFT_359442 [Aspergillus saccharolyticus JOP 1030-1]PYH40150.1 hypothetical protein BP01DRAFT_361515 [Aspergillus saccharolyticus JOP 1030-1]PYH42348.1 hypothetical protein BP01DRAFT_359442 [Aspergillus saccharolyticus JOP 1030-1]